MLERITLKNFKGLQHADLELKRINILIGKNGSGKSSVLHALGVLRRSSTANEGGKVLLDLGYINLGKFKDVLGKAGESTIFIKGSSTFVSEILYHSTLEVGYTCSLSFDQDGMLNYKTSIFVPNRPTITNEYHRFGGSTIDPREYKSYLSRIPLQPVNQVGAAFAFSSMNPDANLTPEENRRVNRAYNELSRLARVIFHELNRMQIVSTIRGLVQPRHSLLKQKTPDVNIETGLTDMGAAFSTNLLLTGATKRRISELARRVTGVDVEIEPEEGHQLSVTNPRKGTNMINEGYGSNQLLFLLEKLVSSEVGSTIGIEEPELHLHPTAQWELANVICKIAISQDKQIIMTTHSEHILYAVLGNIAKSHLKPKDVAIFQFEIDDNYRPKGPKELKIDDKGRVEGGLQGFIEANLKALDDFISE